MHYFAGLYIMGIWVQTGLNIGNRVSSERNMIMVTVKDIAKASGVSASTVSIILNGKSQERKISEKTCQKVWKAVKDLGYQPSIAARTLREGEKNAPYTIALYWAKDFRTTMLSRFLNGLETVRQNTDIPYEITVYPYDTDHLNRQKALLTGRRFHAAILANTSQADIDFIKNAFFPVPVVLYNRQLPGFYSVAVDNFRMGALAGEALLQKGKKMPRILTWDTTFPGMEQRIAGFISTMADHGIQVAPDHILHGHNSPESGAAMTRRILNETKCCDSIYCLSDAAAYGCLFTLNQAKISVPETISVISIGNGEKEYAMYATPPLSTVYLPMEDMASHCLSILLAHLSHQPVPSPQILLDTPLILRTS